MYVYWQNMPMPNDTDIWGHMEAYKQSVFDTCSFQFCIQTKNYLLSV